MPPGYYLPGGAANIAITALTGILWTTLVFLVRVFLRRNVNGPFGYDDAACAAATALGIVQSALVLTAVHHGLGWRYVEVSADDLDRMFIFVWIYNIIYILALALAIVSVALLMCRITTNRKVIRSGHVVVVMTSIWALTSVGIYAFKCDLPKPWVFEPLDRCLNIWHIWLGNGIINVMIELGLLKVGVFLVWGVKMPMKAKAKVLIAFALRLLVLPPTVVRLVYVYKAMHGDDLTYDRIDTTLLSQVTMNVSIILATVPCAKPFFAVLEGGIFRSPLDPISKNSFSNSRVSSSTTAGSRAIDGGNRTPAFPAVGPQRGPSTRLMRPKPQPAIPMTWNHRETWAKPFKKQSDPLQSDLALNRQHSRLNPFGWNRRVTFAKKPSISSDIPLRRMGTHTESSSKLSRRLSFRTSSPSSSKHTSLSKLPRASLPSRMKSRDSSTHTDAPETPSPASRRRRQSSAEFGYALSNEDSQNITCVRHDPEDAERRARKRSLEAREANPGGLEPMKSFQITPDSEWEHEDAMTVAEQARRRREEAEELRRRGKFGIEQTQSFHVSYDALPPEWGCCGTHVGGDGSRDGSEN